MKYFLFFLIITSCLFSCTNDDTIEQSELLKSEISNLQREIRAISNDLEVYAFQDFSYLDELVSLKIDDFTEKRTLQASKVQSLQNEFNEVVEYETIVCGDFESLDCFVENWDIRKPDGGIVEVIPGCSYNRTTSLRLSAPFIEGKYNIPGIEIEGFVNGIEAATIYKIRFWMRYSGTSDLSNGPLVHVVILQDGDWLDYLYEGNHEVNVNKVVDEDWRLYSFQIATISDSPLEIIFGTNLDDVCVDDIHVVKKDQ